MDRYWLTCWIVRVPGTATLWPVPSVGGTALAYGHPCVYEKRGVDYHWEEFQRYGGECFYNFVYLPAEDAYFDCLYGSG